MNKILQQDKITSKGKITQTSKIPINLINIIYAITPQHQNTIIYPTQKPLFLCFLSYSMLPELVSFLRHKANLLQIIRKITQNNKYCSITKFLVIDTFHYQNNYHEVRQLHVGYGEQRYKLNSYFSKIKGRSCETKAYISIIYFSEYC